jgi:hypothetical protein
MSSTEGNLETGNRPDLSLLETMVGMRRGLAVMVEKGVPPTRDMMLVLMETEKAVYASDGGFIKKDQALGAIIAAFQQGTLSVEDILGAAGIDPKTIRLPKGGFLKRLWDSIRPR